MRIDITPKQTPGFLVQRQNDIKKKTKKKRDDGLEGGRGLGR